MIFINGVEQSSLAVSDRGFQYGDGVFSTVAVRNGQLLLWSRHWRRLVNDCAALNILLNEAFKASIEQTCLRAAQLQGNGVLKVLVTRGTSQRGYAVSGEINPTQVVMLSNPLPGIAQKRLAGVTIRFCSMQISQNVKLAGLKHLNRLENVLARQEWQDPDITEGLLSDINGDVIEGTMTNVFTVSGNVLQTPDLGLSGVAGVMREEILSIAKLLDIPYRVGSIKKADVLQADEVFLSNSLIGIWPVKQCENTRFQVGTEGNPMTQKIMKLLNERGHLID